MSSPHASERTPLLRQDDEVQPSSDRPANNSAASAAESVQPTRGKRWPSIIALAILCLAIVLICVALAVPPLVEEYAKEALVFEPTNLSIDSFTAIGIRARVQGDFYLDASRVHQKPVRDVGRFGTWIAREVESGESDVEIYLSEYGHVLLGRVTVPPVKVNIRNRHYNHIDFLVDLEPGDVDGVRKLAKDFIGGKLKSLGVKAVATVPLKSGLIQLGTQIVTQKLQFQGHDVPAVPHVDIHGLQFAEYGPPGHPEGLKARAVLSAKNDYPIKFDVPPLAFEILVPDCHEDYLVLGTAQTEVVHILPRQVVSASVTGMVRQLPTSLTTACPGSNSSPLDSLLADYLGGRDTTVYVRGGQQDENTPGWIGKLLTDTTLPFSLPGHPFDNLIKDFALANVHFGLPDPSADPDTPAARPKVSAVVKALVGLPAEIDVNLDVDKVRADADVFYLDGQLGKLDLREWQPANATKVGENLLIQSIIHDAPLEITDDALFAKVVQELAFGKKGVTLGVRATVDVSTLTVLGEFVVRNIPAEGKIFVKPLGGGFKMPEISGMEVVDTSDVALTLQARVNVTNPTEYSASIPRCNVSLWVNATRVGYAWASADIVPGPNDVVVRASWEVGPVGSEWLSQYISGYNTTFTVKTHAHSIPSLPDIGLEMTLPTPRLFGKFLKETTMHVLSSTATFVLVSPVALYITSIAAAAYYNGTEVGTIDWGYPFALDSGENVTPRLPVNWGSDALGTIRDALGGTLKLDARADVGVRIGDWNEQIWYEGRGLGAKIRL